MTKNMFFVTIDYTERGKIPIFKSARVKRTNFYKTETIRRDFYACYKSDAS